MADKAEPAPANGKATKLTLRRANDKGKDVAPITATPDKEEWVLGRDDPKQKPDIDLGKDSACSRNQGAIVYKAEKFVFKQRPSTAVAGYVLTAGKKFQILENFIIDFGGKQKALFTFSDVLPASQVKNQPLIVKSPVFILEGRTEGIQKKIQEQVNLKVSRVAKNAETQVAFDDKKSIASINKDSNYEWEYDTASAKSIFDVDFKGKFIIGYVSPQNVQTNEKKGFLYIQVVEEDPDCPVVYYFFNKDQLKNNKESDDFLLENGERVVFGVAQYDVQLD